MVCKEFNKYYESLDRAGKENLAERLSTSRPYLSMIYTGKKQAGRKILANIYEASYGHVEIMNFFPDSIK